MWRYKSFLIGVVGVLLFGGLAQAFAVESIPAASYVSGEIVWLDLQLGRLQLYGDRSRDTRPTTEYRITEHETRVTDRSDNQFLAIKDLRAGQHITVESKASGEEYIATKITVEPSSAPLFQQAEGMIEAIDVNRGTFTLKETAIPGTVGLVSVFFYDTRDIVVMENPSLQPVRLEVKPGDFVRVEYVVNDGRRYARSMMRYSVLPVAAPTTTTTTTTSTTTTQ